MSEMSKSQARWALAGLLLLSETASANTDQDILADPSGRLQIVQWGLYDTTETEKTSTPEEHTLSGEISHLQSSKLLRQTSTVCAALGISFGIHAFLKTQQPDASMVITYVTTHPMMTLPNGRSGDLERFERPLSNGQTMELLWMFESPSEVVPGTYTFSLRQHDQVMVQKVFQVRTDCGGKPVS